MLSMKNLISDAHFKEISTNDFLDILSVIFAESAERLFIINIV